MLINFRHGIVKHQTDGSLADFLRWNGPNIGIYTENNPVIVTFSHLDQDYLHHELNSSPNAFAGPFAANTQLWIDLNIQTGVRTFFTSTANYTVSTTAPSTPVIDDHWYDKTQNVMKTFNGIKWIPVIRLILGTVAASNQIKSFNGTNVFTGTQVGSHDTVDVGSLLLDHNDRPILRYNKTFVTTTTLMSTTVATTSLVKFESMGFYAVASQPMANKTVVYIGPDSRIYPASNYEVQTQLCGIIEEDVVTGELTRIATSGMYFKDGWNWSTPSASLYVSETGDGSLTEVWYAGASRVGYVVDTTTVYMSLSSGGSGSSEGDKGEPGSPGAPGAKGEPGDVQSVVLDEDQPTPTSLGGIPAGTTFDNVPVDEVLRMLLYPYQTPSFSSFTIQGLTDSEVGNAFTASDRTVSWAFNNGGNVTANTLSLYDVTNSMGLLSNVSNLSPATVSFGNITSNSATSYTWRISAVNTQGATFTRNFTINWRWAVHYGESVDPSITGFDVPSLRIKTLMSNSNGTYNMLGGGYKYISYPVSMGLKTTFKDAATNLDVAMSPAYTVTVINQYGVSALYYVHRTTNILGGSITIIVS